MNKKNDVTLKLIDGIKYKKVTNTNGTKWYKKIANTGDLDLDWVLVNQPKEDA